MTTAEPLATETIGAALLSNNTCALPRVVARTPLLGSGAPCCGLACGKLATVILTTMPGVTGPPERLASLTTLAAVTTGGVGLSVTVALADLVLSATLVAVMVTVCVEATRAGAV